MQWHAVSIKQRRLARLTPCLLFGVMSLGGCRHQDKSLVVLVHGSIQAGAVLAELVSQTYQCLSPATYLASPMWLPLKGKSFWPPTPYPTVPRPCPPPAISTSNA